MFPVKLDIENLDRELATLLASLEDRIRNFETGDKPAYENWLRVELGPFFSVLDELAEKIHARRILAHRVNSLVQNEGLHPREALFLAMNGNETEEASPKKNGFDAEEIEARRRAKIESKRARRRAEKKEAKREKVREEEKPTKNRLVSIYRSLARMLHPDSPLAEKNPRALSLWYEVQAAYDGGNLDRLLSISAWLSSKGERPQEVLTTNERMERIRAMKRSIVKLETTLKNLSLHVAWQFRKKLGNEKKKLRKRAARELEEEVARTQEVLDMLEDFIDSIGPAKEPSKKKRS
jgi:hypothetical protein